VGLAKLLILAKESELIYDLINRLDRKGHACTLITHEEKLASNEPADLLLIEIENGLVDSITGGIVQRIKQDRHIPIILLLDKQTLQETENFPNIEDFVLKPYDPDEVSMRIKRILKNNNSREESTEYLKAGNITIDLPRCEVSVAGRIVDLTFTEYELLKLLVSKKGRVLTREVLLNQIWGYDYFGGDRTVDVHITRLRSKIEDPSHNFIETVRNIGYRIKADDK
jgi:DNA-binding response OmpR family regulator